MIAIGLIYLYISQRNVFKFKKFIFEVPDNMAFTKETEDTFKIAGEGYDAIVDIFYTELEDIHSQDTVYATLLKETGINVGPAIKRTINDTDVLCFKKEDEEELLCYFETFSPFVYEVTLQKNVSIDNLTQVVEVLLKGKYNTKSNAE